MIWVLRQAPIVSFLVLAALAATVVFLPIGEHWKIMIFVILMLTLAVRFPHRVATLDKDRVDLLYYSTAMLIAMVIFLSKPLERTRLEFDEQIAALTSEQQAMEAEIRSFDYIASNTEAVLGDVNQKINDRLAWLDTEKTTECACAYVGGFSCGETLPSPMRPSGGGQPDQVMVRRYRAMQQCVKLEDLLKNAENDRRLEARGLAETTRLIDLLKREQELPGPLPIDNMPVPLPQIMELMEHARQDGKAWRGNKVQQQEDLKQEQNTWVDKRRKLGETGRSGLALWAGRIVEFYWPYILISFLGMKVARVNYIQKLRDR